MTQKYKINKENGKNKSETSCILCNLFIHVPCSVPINLDRYNCSTARFPLSTQLVPMVLN